MVMQTDDNGRELTPAEAEDLKDTLIAISVVAKRLARKARQENMEKEVNQSEQDERTGNVPG